MYLLIMAESFPSINKKADILVGIANSQIRETKGESYHIYPEQI